jgi:membrane-bound serine protease (ClpP class)
MNGRALRSVFWLLLVSLIAAQTPAVEPAGDAGKLGVSGVAAPQQATVQTPPTTSPDLYRSNLVLPSGSNIAVIPITGVVYDFTFESLQRRVDKALAEGATLIVIELDTPGGVATSAMKISKYIRTLPVPTVAWVNNEALSAGIMIAAACDEIVMSPASLTGDCAPIIPGMNLAATERAKALSPILEEFRDSAQDNGYDFVMFQAMCVLGVEVYMVEKADGSGERRLVNQIDYAVMVKGDAPQDYASQTPPPGGAAQLPAVEDVGAVTLSVATDADRGAWRAVEVLPSGDNAPGGMVHDGKTLLTRNQKRAADIGLSKATIANQTELQKNYRAGSVVVVAPTWSEGLAAVLTSWWARIILIIVCLIGAYIEMQAPGLSVPGAVAAAALLLLIGAPYIIGLAEVWHILLFLVGFVLVIIELVFTPTFGLLGIAGLMMMFMGVVLSVVPSGQGAGGQGVGWLPPPEMWDRMVASMFFTLLALLASGVGFYYITKHFGKIPGLNRLILQTAQPSAAAVGMDTAGNPIHVSGDEVLGVGVITVGLAGIALTELRPSGMARFGEHNVDVVSVGPFIEKGDKVQVVEVRGNRIVVDQA